MSRRGYPALRAPLPLGQAPPVRPQARQHRPIKPL